MCVVSLEKVCFPTAAESKMLPEAIGVGEAAILEASVTDNQSLRVLRHKAQALELATMCNLPLSTISLLHSSLPFPLLLCPFFRFSPSLPSQRLEFNDFLVVSEKEI